MKMFMLEIYIVQVQMRKASIEMTLIWGMKNEPLGNNISGRGIFLDEIIIF